MNERLMMSEEECRKKVKELLQIPKEDLLTKYMFQEQEIERLNNIINDLEKDIKSEIERTECLIEDDYSHGLGSFGEIRRMLNDTRKSILFRLKKLKESGNNE